MRKYSKLFVSAVLMIILIVDSDTARFAAYEGLDLCIRSVIPSLFPFILLSTFLNKYLENTNFVIFRPVCKLCKIPTYCTSYLLLGIFGGYPVGAKSINDAYKNGQITKAEGHRLLSFCNNAGPSFIFGIVGTLFVEKSAIWVLWGIHIISALLVGIVLPAVSENTHMDRFPKVARPGNITSGIKTMSTICTWVIVFKMLLVFCDKWILADASVTIRVLLSGFLELTNGCIQLNNISNCGLRFILSSVFLSFGGMCITMQTLSVTREIGHGKYFLGKILQTGFSFILAYTYQRLLFTPVQTLIFPTATMIFISATLILAIFLTFRKKVIAFHKNFVYTVDKT